MRAALVAGQIAALLGAFGWAAAGVAIKTVSSSVGAVRISAAYSWVGFLMILPVVALAGRLASLTSMPAASFGWLASAGALYAVSDLAFIRLLARGAVGWTFVTTTSLFILFSLLAAILLLDERIAWTAYPGATAIVAGIYLVNRREGQVLPAGSEIPGGSGIRARFAMSAGIAALWTVGLLATDIGVEDADPLAAALVLSAVPAMFYLLLAAASPVARLSETSGHQRRRLLVSALFFGSSVMAWTYGLKFESAGIVAILTSSSPLFAVVLAAIFLRERLDPTAAAGVILCMGGIAAVLAG